MNSRPGGILLSKKCLISMKRLSLLLVVWRCKFVRRRGVGHA